jgi:hypothetical protein
MHYSQDFFILVVKTLRLNICFPILPGLRKVADGPEKAAESNNTLVAAHAVSVSSTQDVIQWYNIDVSSGTPTLADQGRVSGGAKTRILHIP